MGTYTLGSATHRLDATQDDPRLGTHRALVPQGYPPAPCQASVSGLGAT